MKKIKETLDSFVCEECGSALVVDPDVFVIPPDWDGPVRRPHDHEVKFYQTPEGDKYWEYQCRGYWYGGNTPDGRKPPPTVRSVTPEALLRVLDGMCA